MSKGALGELIMASLNTFAKMAQVMPESEKKDVTKDFLRRVSLLET